MKDTGFSTYTSYAVLHAGKPYRSNGWADIQYQSAPLPPPQAGVDFVGSPDPGNPHLGCVPPYVPFLHIYPCGVGHDLPTAMPHLSIGEP